MVTVTPTGGLVTATTGTVCKKNNLAGKSCEKIFFLLLNSVYTVLPLSQGLDRVKGGTIHMKTVRYVHTKLCLSVYTEYY